MSYYPQDWVQRDLNITFKISNKNGPITARVKLLQDGGHYIVVLGKKTDGSTAETHWPTDMIAFTELACETPAVQLAAPGALAALDLRSARRQ